MAVAAVSSVVQTLSLLLTKEAKFLCGVKNQASELKKELQRFQCFLEDADLEQRKSKTFQNSIAEIRELAYSADITIRAFLDEVQPKRRARGGNFLNILKRCVCILNEVVALHKVGSDINEIKIKMDEFTKTLPGYTISEGDRSTSTGRGLELRRTYSHIVEENFIGFEDDLRKVVACLLNEKKEQPTYRAVLIHGMGGQGKTTLGRKVYHFPDIRRHFQGFAWACVSQQWTKKDVLQTILISLMPNKNSDEVRRMEDPELVRQLYDVQKEKKCLVVLDDVWSPQVWESISAAFPSGETVGSKILLTSRNIGVVSNMNNCSIHELKLLSDEESWQLFKSIFRESASTDLKIEGDKENLGRQMVKHCGGLPLAIIVLGGILKAKHHLMEWEKVHRNIRSYLKEGKDIKDEQGIVMQVLSYSYQDLPYQLKPCFLYLGLYPEDHKIELEQLYQLWIAEDFISLEEIKREETSMDVAQRYMVELVQRCMVQLQPNKWTGRFEYCQIHDLMRDMCLQKIKEENFGEIVDCRLGETSSSLSIHRLVFHWDDEIIKYSSHFVKLRERNRYTRSLVLFGNGGNGSFDPSFGIIYGFTRELKFLTTLHIETVFGDLEGRQFQKLIRKLIHLRYLRYGYCETKKMPSSISELRYLQTLDFGSLILSEMYIPNVLWKMECLRNLHLPRDFKTKGKLRLEGLVNLEILENFESSTCNIHDLCKLSNLRQLKGACVCCDNGEIIKLCNNITSPNKKSPHVPLQDSSITFDYCNFCSEEELNLLRQLLMGHHFNDVSIRGLIKEMPILSHDQISSSNLTSLDLSWSGLEKDPMPMLGKLPNLRKIKLGLDCFFGEEMVCSAGGFPHLKYLRLSDLMELEEWKLEEGAMPSLSRLEIVECRKLKMIPDGLTFVTTLQELAIDRMPQEFADRLKVIDGREGEDFHKVRHIPSIRFGRIIRC